MSDPADTLITTDLARRVRAAARDAGAAAALVMIEAADELLCRGALIDRLRAELVASKSERRTETTPPAAFARTKARQQANGCNPDNEGRPCFFGFCTCAAEADEGLL